jgi:hypothetical protein
MHGRPKGKQDRDEGQVFVSFSSVILSLSCGSAAWQIVTLSERNEVEGEVPLGGTQSKDLHRSFIWSLCSP